MMSSKILNFMPIKLKNISKIIQMIWLYHALIQAQVLPKNVKGRAIRRPIY